MRRPKDDSTTTPEGRKPAKPKGRPAQHYPSQFELRRPRTDERPDNGPSWRQKVALTPEQRERYADVMEAAAPVFKRGGTAYQAVRRSAAALGVEMDDEHCTRVAVAMVRLVMAGVL